MWAWTDWKLRRALRRYRRERDLEAVLQMDWHRDLDLSAFFTDVEERLHGEEITRLRQKQAEYLALQNQINPHFLYNALEAIRTDALLANCPDIAETTEALATFFRYTISNVQEYVTFSDELDNAENYFTIQRCRFGDKICGATRFLRNLDRIFEKKWVSFLEEFLGRVHSDAPLAGERRFFIKSHLSAPQNTVRSAHGAGTGG